MPADPWRGYDECRESFVSKPIVSCALIWAATFAYALLRYVVLGPVPASEIPLFILNKSLSFAAIVLFAASWFVPRAYGRVFGVVGTWLAFTHAVVSVGLLLAGGFDGLRVDGGGLSWRGWGVVGLGVLGVVGLIWQRQVMGRRVVRAVRIGVVAIAVVHVTVLGWAGWWAPEAWYGGMVPITLVAAGVGVFGVGRGLLRRRQ